MGSKPAKVQSKSKRDIVIMQAGRLLIAVAAGCICIVYCICICIEAEAGMQLNL
jgi:hypothetical protein